MRSCSILFFYTHLLTTISALRLPRVLTSGMVLQAERPRVFGWAAPGAPVSATTSDGEHVAATADGKDGVFLLRLQSRPAKVADTGIQITIESGNTTAVLSDILFGDVWICSGQSNMEFSVSEAFDRDAIIATAGDQRGLRLFAVQKNASAGRELDDLVDVQYAPGWVRSTPQTVCGAEYNNDGYDPATNKTQAYCGPHCGPSASVKSFARRTWGYFSAACFLHGRALLRETGRPQGLIESCWGGTSIQSWSSAAALAKCAGDEGHGADTDAALATATATGDAGSSLWNGMITPLLKLPVKGHVWYQGEAQAGSSTTGNKYSCQMKALISDWRQRWAARGNGNEPAPVAVPHSSMMTTTGVVRETATAPVPPFIIAAIAPSSGRGSPFVRYSQWGAAASSFFGGKADAAAALEAVGVANLIDLLDSSSPCGAVHIRNKTTVGERLAAAALALGYNRSDVTWNGPVPKTIAVDDAGRSVTVSFTSSDGSAAAVDFVALDWNGQTTAPESENFEVLLASSSSSSSSSGASWQPARATVAKDGTSVTVLLPAAPPLLLNGSSGGRKPGVLLPGAVVVKGIRYAFADKPAGKQLFGRLDQLPAMPFLATCDSAEVSTTAVTAVPPGQRCVLAQPGQVPTISRSRSNADNDHHHHHHHHYYYYQQQQQQQQQFRQQQLGLAGNPVGAPQDLSLVSPLGHEICKNRSRWCSVLVDVPAACATESAGAAGSAACPVLFCLHGFGGNATKYIDTCGPGVHASGFIGVYPQGDPLAKPRAAGRPPVTGWNDGMSVNPENSLLKCRWDDFNCTDDPNDTAYIEAIVRALRAVGAHGRLYVFGQSNGAAWAQRLGANAGPTLPFAGIAPQSGQLDRVPPRSAAGPYNANQPLSGRPPIAVLAIHGTEDKTIPYAGGPKFDSPVFIMYSEPDSDKVWAEHNGCSNPSSASYTNVTAEFDDQVGVASHWVVEGCKATAPVEWYETFGAGHVGTRSVGGIPVVDAVLAFFSRVDAARAQAAASSLLL